MSKKNIVIIDYGMGNLRSIYNALKYLGVQSVIAEQAEALKGADAVILPGVGAFENGMNELQRRNFIEAIYRYVDTGRPLLGICLGMQLLMSRSYEFGKHNGLNLIEGEVIPFQNKLVNGRYNFKVPHIGWNELRVHGAGWQNSLLDHLESGESMYFVHSFFAVPQQEDHMLAVTEYGNNKFCSVSKKDNVTGCQFHPERSARMGLKILENFIGT